MNASRCFDKTRFASRYLKDHLMEQLGALPLEGNSNMEGDERAWVHAAQADATRFNVLYHMYVDRVYRYLLARTSSAEDAADLTQQVFLQALDALPKYRERSLPFAAWLFRIARNVTIDAHRRQQSTLGWDAVPPSLQHAEAIDPEAAALHEESLAHLRALLVQLDASKRELLALRFAAGLSSRQIAAVVGKREAAVKKQLSRTIHMLKEQYHEE
jgi:RNA polymerase sigma-70 factor (ECF subfamily)